MTELELLIQAADQVIEYSEEGMISVNKLLNGADYKKAQGLAFAIAHLEDVVNKIKWAWNRAWQTPFNSACGEGMNDQWANERKDLIKQILVLQVRLDEIVKYCEPHQKYMWAKYITGIAKAKADWRDNDTGSEPESK